MIPNDIILDIYRAETVDSPKILHWCILCLVQRLSARLFLAAEDADDVVNSASVPHIECIFARWHDVLIRRP